MWDAFIPSTPSKSYDAAGMNLEDPYCVRYTVDVRCWPDRRDGWYRATCTIRDQEPGGAQAGQAGRSPARGVGLMEIEGHRGILGLHNAKNVFIIDGDGLSIAERVSCVSIRRCNTRFAG